MKCISCENEFQGKFCPECGEKGDTKPISFYSVVTSVFSSFTNMDGGLLYNFKHLTISPRITIEQYINGKRKGVFNPITYAILLVSLYILITSFFEHSPSVNLDKNNLKDNSLYQLGENFGYLVRVNLKYFWLLNIVYLSIFTKLFFKKYNFFEHLAISSFIIGHSIIIAIISFVLFRMPIIIDPIVGLTIVLFLYATFKKENNKFITIVLSIISTFLCYMLFYSIPIIFLVLTK